MDNVIFNTSKRDLAYIFFKRKWSILTIVLVTLFSAAVWIWLIRDNMYEVSAKVLVKIGYEQMTSNTAFKENAMIISQRYQDVNTEVDILSNTELMGMVVDYLELDKQRPPVVPAGLVARLRYEAKRLVRALRDFKDELLIKYGFRERLTPREKAVLMLYKGLLVGPQKDSNVIIARLFIPAREGAATILNTYLDFYQNFRLKLFQNSRSLDFLNDQTTLSLKRLQKSEEDLRRLEESYDIIAIGTQKEILLKRIAEAKAFLNEAEIQLNEVTSKARRIEAEMKGKAPDFSSLGDLGGNPFLENTVRELSALQRDRARLLMTDLDSGARIRNNREQYALLMGQLSSHLEALLTERRSTFDSRKEILEGLRAELDRLHGTEQEWQSLRRNITIMENEYMLFRKKQEEAKATDALGQNKIGNVIIIQRAMDPLAPTGLRKTTLLGASCVFALFAALSWASIAEFFDHRIYTTTELAARLKSPVLTVIPMDRKLARKGPAAWNKQNTGL